MKQVNSRVVINQSAIKSLQRNAITALKMTGDYVLDQVVEKQVMPFDMGTMQNESTYVDDKDAKQGMVHIVSSEPYARRLYYHPEYTFKTENNPHAKGKWLEDWTEAGKYAKEVKKAYGLFLKKLGGI
ncbi:MAG: hypothetical protein RR585_10435 [Coprobacillus sp.]